MNNTLHASTLNRDMSLLLPSTRIYIVYYLSKVPFLYKS